MKSTGDAARKADARLDAVFHALADRTRRLLLARLAEGPARVTDLARPIAMALPTVSKHIRVLEVAGLVARTIEGRVHRCALAASPLQEADAWIGHYRCFWDETLDALAHYAEEHAPHVSARGRRGSKR